jgi:uncharacterized protein (TIGR02145 family)
MKTLHFTLFLLLTFPIISCSKDQTNSNDNPNADPGTVKKEECGCTKSNLNLGTISFLNQNTWQIGNQIWSAPVTISYCKKKDYDGGKDGAYKADGCENISDNYAQLFSWCLIRQYEEEISINGWRIPTQTDFEELYASLGGVHGPQTLDQYKATLRQFTNFWGINYSGSFWFRQGDTEPTEQGEFVVYWCKDEADSRSGKAMSISNGTGFGVLGVDTKQDWYKENGACLRLVKVKQ